MSTQILNLSPALYQYMLDVSSREPKILKRLREETAMHESSVMQISPLQGQFMALLVELTGARKLIEIGTYTGYSALCMALALPEDGHLICCDVNKEWTDIAKRYWDEAGVAEHIDLRLAPALQTLESLLKHNGHEQFDMAFIDADKTNYRAYYESCLRLLRPGGMLLIDNTLWGGAVADNTDQQQDTCAIRQLNEHIYNDDRVSLSLLPIGDGLTIALKKSAVVPD